MDFQDKNQHWISMFEASKLCAYSHEYLSLLARRGKIFSKKIGRNWYTTREAIDNYLKTQSVFVSLPKNIFGKLTASLTPEEPEEIAGHEGHSRVFEEFERLNPQILFGAGKKIKPQVPSVSQPTQSIQGPPLPARAVLGSGPPASEEKDVLKKLDRLSGSLELFADRVTRKLDQPSQEPLTPEQKEFFEMELSSVVHRFKKFDKYARSMMRNPVRMMVIMITAVVAIFIIGGGFSFGQVDYVVQQVKKVFKDADTVQGHFPGTHANEVLVLDKAGNISIYGHIETQGQLRSHAPDGVAPMVVDSTTLVDNLNANYLDGLASKDFTLAFVTKNGNLTYEDVKLEGNVEVGKTLTVKGATKLMDSLQVYGGLGVFGDAVFGKDIILQKGTIKISNTSLIKNLNAEFLDGIKKQNINLDFVTSNGASTANGITVGALEVNGQSDFRAPGFFYKGVWGSDGAFGTLGVAGDVHIGNKDKSENSRFEVYSKKFKVDKNGNVTTADLVVTKILSDLVPSGSYDLGSSASPWDELNVSSASFSTLTITGTGGGNFEGTTSSSFRINTDNTTADTESSYLSFERGTTTPNAVIKWDSTNKQFNFNQPVKITSGSFELIGTASISGDLVITGSGSASGQLKATRAPVTAHTGTWPNFSGTGNATLYVNPSSSVADGNLFVAAIDGTPKLVVDAEGDLFVGGNLTLSGTTTQATTTVTGDLLVEGNTRLGDASTDKIYFVGSVVPRTLTSIPLIIKASASQTSDLFRINDPDDNRILTVDFPSGLLVSSSGFNFAMGTSTATVSYSRLGTATTTHSNYISSYNDLLISGDLEVNASAQFDSFLQVGTNTLYANPTTGNVGIGTTSPTSLLTVQGRGEFQGTASASYFLTGNTLQVGGFSSAAYSRFGTDTTGYTNFITTTNDLLISGDLEVNASAVFDSFVKIANTGSASLEIMGGGTDAENRFRIISGGSSHELLHLTNNTGSRIVTIASGGNLGIGSTSPTQKLDVAGTITATDITCSNCLGQGDIANAAVGTGELNTATGSSESASTVNVAMNDYSFFPSIEQNNCVISNGDDAVRVFGTNATNDTVGRFGMSMNCSSGNWFVGWRYVTASDRPTIWLIANFVGDIVSVWESEDPVRQTKWPENPNPFNGSVLKEGQRSVNVSLLTITQLQNLYSSLPSADIGSIFSKLRRYLVEERKWLDQFNDLQDIANISERYEPAARLWAMRFVARHYDLELAELIMGTMTVGMDNTLLLKQDYGSVLADYLVWHQASIAAIAAQSASLPANQQSADLAEWYTSVQPVESGDVVSIGRNGFIIRSSGAYDQHVLGVVSTAPNQVIGKKMTESDVRLALTGRVPIKVSLENGPIVAGDRLATSSTPGVAMKATEAGMTIGVALEPLEMVTLVSYEKILIFVNLSYWAPSESQMSINGEFMIRNDTASTSFSNVLIVSSLDFSDITSGSRAVVVTIIKSVFTKVQNLWVSGDFIAEGIKKTYYAVASITNSEFLISKIGEWGTREITISPTADEPMRSLFSGNGAQAAGESKLDLQENGTYLATYGVDSTRGEIQLSGSSDLINGEAKVFFDFSFSSIISGEVPLKVLVTPTTNSIQGQLVAMAKTQYGFTVKELNGTSAGKFDWLVIARRKGYEGQESFNVSGFQSLTDSEFQGSTGSELIILNPEPTVASSSPALTEPVLVSPVPEPMPASSSQPIIQTTPEPEPETLPLPSESPTLESIPEPSAEPMPAPAPEV